MFYKRLLNQDRTGSISIFVVIMGVVVATLVGGIVVFASVGYTSTARTESFNEALAIAESGLYYYRWHLAHAPNDYQDGTGQPGPYVHDYNDPQSGVSGQYSLDITAPEEGSQIVIIKSTGWTNKNPGVKRVVTARFGPEPLTKFSFLQNSNVWFGQGLIVFGDVFSNGGIRFDGINMSKVQSTKETYTCGSETGCNNPTTKGGVWGNGGPQDLWEFPVPVFDFDSVISDFSTMKQAAQATGVYLGPTPNWGYHLIFKANGTVDVYRVTSASNKSGWSSEDDCQNLYQTINSQTFLTNYSLSNKKIFYLEDTTWVEGTINGKTTVVAARLPTSSYDTNIWINNNLVYLDKNGDHRLGLIAENDIYFAYDIPTDFEVDGALMAQDGKIIRHSYNQGSCTNGSKSKSIRNMITIYGSIISSGKSYWNFSGYGGIKSGFINREITYDNLAAETPPPYFPSTTRIKFLSWEEGN